MYVDLQNLAPHDCGPPRHYGTAPGAGRDRQLPKSDVLLPQPALNILMRDTTGSILYQKSNPSFFRPLFNASTCMATVSRMS